MHVIAVFSFFALFYQVCVFLILFFSSLRFKSHLLQIEGWQVASLEVYKPCLDAAAGTYSDVSWGLHPACCCFLLVSCPCSEAP